MREDGHAVGHVRERAGVRARAHVSVRGHGCPCALSRFCSYASMARVKYHCACVGSYACASARTLLFERLLSMHVFSAGVRTPQRARSRLCSRASTHAMKAVVCRTVLCCCRCAGERMCMSACVLRGLAHTRTRLCVDTSAHMRACVPPRVCVCACRQVRSYVSILKHVHVS